MDKLAGADDSAGRRAVSVSVMMRVRLALTRAFARGKLRPLGLDRGEGGRDIFCSPDFEWRNFDAQLCELRPEPHPQFQHSLGIANISHDCQSAETGNNLAQEFKSLASSIGLLEPTVQ